MWRLNDIYRIGFCLDDFSLSFLYFICILYVFVLLTVHLYILSIIRVHNTLVEKAIF